MIKEFRNFTLNHSKEIINILTYSLILVAMQFYANRIYWGIAACAVVFVVGRKLLESRAREAKKTEIIYVRGY